MYHKNTLVVAKSPAPFPFLKIKPVYGKKSKMQNLAERGVRLNADFYMFFGNVKPSVYKRVCT
jgi:hypothetical protein